MNNDKNEKDEKDSNNSELSNQQKINDSEEIEEVIAEMLDSDEVPMEKKVKAVEMLMMSSSQQSIMKNEPDISDKITSDHITQYLTGAEKNMDLSYREEVNKKWYNLALVIVSGVLVVFLVIYLKDTPNLLDKVISALFGFVTGAFGGYGLGKVKRNE